MVMDSSFDWDEEKNQENVKKHDISFYQAQKAFQDSQQLIYEDVKHSTEKEKRYFLLGKIGKRVCTVRFTYRGKVIRIFGAGYWRKEQKLYEKENKQK